MKSTMQSTIRVTVDAAYAFDMYSIAEIKSTEINSNDSYLRLALLEKEITDQIGRENFLYVFNSKEYRDLSEANCIVWEMVKASKDNEVTAKEVDEANYQRHVTKIALQKRFFASGLTEEKKRD